MLLFSKIKLQAQVNLVPNPSFEIMDTCPYFQEFPYRSIYHALPWFQPFLPLNSTDYFNPCNSNILDCSAPLNYEGYQQAKTGNSYAGFSTGYINPQNNVREYLEVELTDSLIFGRQYCVTFFVSLANNTKRSTDGLQAYLSTIAILYSNPQLGVLSNLIPQISNPNGNIINDTLNWVEVTGEFYAIGGEKFITIGNFKTDANTGMFENTYGIHWYSYYYIDDVSVVLCDSITGIIEKDLKNFSLSPNPASDLLQLNNLPTTVSKIRIYDLQGRVVLRKEIQSQNKKQEINISDLSSGIYLLKLESADGVVARKFVKR